MLAPYYCLPAFGPLPTAPRFRILTPENPGTNISMETDHLAGQETSRTSQMGHIFEKLVQPTRELRVAAKTALPKNETTAQ